MTLLSAIYPGRLWLDNNGMHINAHGGGVLHHNGVYYWFGEHKIEGPEGNKAHVGVHVYSSRDLYNWRDEGIALSVSDDPASPITRGCILERPKVIYNRKNNCFVMWFHLEPLGAGYGGALSGVAISRHVTGPYTFIRSFRPNAGFWPMHEPEHQCQMLTAEESQKVRAMNLVGAPRPYFPRDLIFRRDFQNGQMARDMTLFVDDDGAAYHLYASEENGTLHISQLTDDYLACSGRYIRVFPGRFHEAPAMMKYRGRYFLFTSECTGWVPNAARLAVADSVWGPWTELTNPCIGTGEQIINTFESQSTFILPVADCPDTFIFMADRWRPRNPIDGRYVWLPIEFHHEIPMISWQESWQLPVVHAAETVAGRFSSLMAG